MISDKLINYIRQAQQKGTDRGVLTNKLLKVGWSQKDIDNAFFSLDHPSATIGFFSKSVDQGGILGYWKTISFLLWGAVAVLAVIIIWTKTAGKTESPSGVNPSIQPSIEPTLIPTKIPTKIPTPTKSPSPKPTKAASVTTVPAVTAKFQSSGLQTLEPGITANMTRATQEGDTIKVSITFSNKGTTKQDVMVIRVVMKSQTKGEGNTDNTLSFSLSPNETRVLELSYKLLPDPPFEWIYTTLAGGRVILGTYKL